MRPALKLCLIILPFVLLAALIFAKMNYLSVYLEIQKGNEIVIKHNLSDGCFPYRYFHRGCYYDVAKNYLVASDLRGYGLSHEEIVALCYSFAHKGAVAYCLNANNETARCHAFSSNNAYLNRVCGLQDGELIPSQQMGPYQTDTNPHVDSWDTIELVGYTDLTSNG
jgi:hypothetical protein